MQSAVNEFLTPRVIQVEELGQTRAKRSEENTSELQSLE